MSNEPLTDSEKIERALIALEWGQMDGAHHKMWAIDQAVRALTGDDYEEWVTRYCAGRDGPDTYDWETGVAP